LTRYEGSGSAGKESGDGHSELHFICFLSGNLIKIYESSVINLENTSGVYH
jgi:hypothetical protein